MRGAGNINWQYLNANYPSYYPSTFTATQQTNAVKNTCASGYIWNTAKNKATSTPVADYLAIPNAYTILSSILPGKNIANESAMTRGAATPITYNLKITQNGLLSLYVSYGGGTYLPVITKQDITASNGAVPSSFRFGFAGSTGGSTNIHEILCFQATPADVAGTSVGINQKEATKIESGTQAFLAYYYPSTWTGRLTASDLLYNAATKSISISSTANWDASCNLTGIAAGAGNACPSTGVVGPVAAQAPATRAMLAWDGTSSKGVAFEWNSSTSGSAISSAEQATLDAGDPTPINANRLNYLRGDRTNEINTLGAGLYRARDGVLGDIIDSSPTWVGPPVSPYAAVWQDRIVAADPLPENSGTQSYAQFLTAEQTRLNVVYDGANDGFLHGFRAGAYDANGNYVNTATTPNDGREVLAYMPYTVLQNIHNTADPTLDYSNAQYSHNYFTDATPGTGELFFGGAWHTWLVGGLGAGGADIYALDVTNPANFSEGNAGSLVVGDWTAATISCANVSTCGNNLGNTYGVPVIRRLHDGKWGVIFGNGFGSKSGDAGIYVMIVDPTSGAVANTYYLSTGVAGSNGIASVATADLDGDHITDYVYAGDLRGNVWRFDLTSGSESAWAASATPLFTIPGAQPITTKLLLATTPSASGAPRVMVDFGAGRKFPQTNLNPVSYQPGTQSLYGIWDWNMGAWNALGGRQFASLSAPQTVGVSNLATQSFTKNADGSLDVTDNAVCWSGSTTCTGGASANNKYGFVATLPNANEQVVFDPALYGNGFIVNTTIPAINSPTSCQLDHDTGDTIAISVSTGGSLHGFFRNTTDTNTAGSQTNATGTPFFVLAGGQSFMLTQTLGGGAVNSAITCQPGDKTCSSNVNSSAVGGKRLTWIERR